MSFSPFMVLSNKIYNILTNELINNVLHLLLNLSRVSYDFKCIWNDSVDSLVILKELALKLSNSINKTFELLCFMTISNIASDDDILKIASENSHVIKSIVCEVSILAIMLKNNSAERIEIKLNEQNSVRIISNYISGWHLIEVNKGF
jgi:dGTP triphosphohydrolase